MGRKHRHWARLLPEDHPRYYFAYGSNLDVVQMQKRCPTSFPVAPCSLPDARLVFSGVLTVETYKGLEVPGALYTVEPTDIVALDRYEGYPHLYEKKYTWGVVDGKRVRVFYYTLNHPYSEYPPTDLYYETVVAGYGDWRLPMSVLRASRKHAFRAQRDSERRHLEELYKQPAFGEDDDLDERWYQRLDNVIEYE